MSYLDISKRISTSFGSISPACRHAEGTISSSSGLDVWRMVSEDSDQLVPGLLVVHRLRQERDLDEPVCGQMPPGPHHLHACRKLLEIEPLRRPERIPLEERDYRLQKVASGGHDILAQVLLVVVVPPVDEEPSHSEELLELLEAERAPRSLRHHEPMAHLKAGLVASPARAVTLPHEPDREASFSVYKADHPTTLLDQPFLLIVRTRHVVTIVNDHSDVTMSSAGYSEFPAYGQMHTDLLPGRGAAINAETGGVMPYFGHVTLGRL
jgi:hypothetical protein